MINIMFWENRICILVLKPNIDVFHALSFIEIVI